MDSQHLKAFLAVADSSSFSIASEQLFLTQSAVSKRIQTLEMQLGTPLFDRHNRSISLTEAGRLLIPRARAILQLLDDTRQQLANLSGSVSGTLSIATSHHIGLHRLPPVLKSFTRAYPDVQLDIRFLASEEAYQAVEQRQVELALTTLESTPRPGVESTRLWQDNMLCVASTDHTLARQNHITLADLAATAAILPEPGSITYRLIAAPFQHQDLTLTRLMPTNYLETIKMMVSVGVGWSVLPEGMVDDNLAVLPWPATPMTRQLGMIRLPDRSYSNAARALIQLLTEQNEKHA